MGDETSSHIDDTDRRTLVNAQDAVQVVRTTSESVENRDLTLRSSPTGSAPPRPLPATNTPCLSPR